MNLVFLKENTTVTNMRIKIFLRGRETVIPMEEVFRNFTLRLPSYVGRRWKLSWDRWDKQSCWRPGSHGRVIVPLLITQRMKHNTSIWHSALKNKTFCDEACCHGMILSWLILDAFRRGYETRQWYEWQWWEISHTLLQVCNRTVKSEIGSGNKGDKTC